MELVDYADVLLRRGPGSYHVGIIHVGDENSAG
jgi:hypothetical protein